MVTWTTPNLKCTIPNDLIFDYILFTLKQRDIVIEKKIEAEQVDNGIFYVSFTQDETGKFKKEIPIEAQLNVISGDNRLATNIISLKITDNLHKEVIE